MCVSVASAAMSASDSVRDEVMGFLPQSKTEPDAVHPGLMPPAKRTEAAGTPCLSAMKSASRPRSVSQAAFTAMPFRSDPDEAAVALVFGTLAVSVAVI